MFRENSRSKGQAVRKEDLSDLVGVHKSNLQTDRKKLCMTLSGIKSKTSGLTTDATDGQFNLSKVTHYNYALDK